MKEACEARSQQGTPSRAFDSDAQGVGKRFFLPCVSLAAQRIRGQNVPFSPGEEDLGFECVRSPAAFTCEAGESRRK